MAQTTADQQMEEYMAQDDQLKTIFDIEESFGLVKVESIKRAIQTTVDFTPRLVIDYFKKISIFKIAKQIRSSDALFKSASDSGGHC